MFYDLKQKCFGGEFFFATRIWWREAVDCGWLDKSSEWWGGGKGQWGRFCPLWRHAQENCSHGMQSRKRVGTPAGTSVWTHAVIVRQHPALAWDFFFKLSEWKTAISFIPGYCWWSYPDNSTWELLFHFLLNESQRSILLSFERNSELSCILILLLPNMHIWSKHGDDL